MKRVRVSAAIIIKDDLILATKRGYGDYKGYWEFPGGKREEGESGEDAIVREIKEELNADIAVDRFLTTVEYQYPGFYLIMDSYICSIVSGDIVLSEHEDAIWLKADDLDTLSWLPADVIIVDKLKEALNNRE